MPVIYKKIQYASQFGYNNTGENYKTDSNAPSIGTNATRSIIFRFNHIEVPKGSTINSATLYIAYSAKNNGDYVTFTQKLYSDTQGQAKWLDVSRAEWVSGNPGATPWRTWSNGTSLDVAFTQGANGDTRTLVGHNVLSHMNNQVNAASWTLAGGSVAFLTNHTPASSPDYTYLSGPNDGWSPMLVIDYTPPASDGKSTVVNIQENSIFTRTLNAAGAFDIAPYGFNEWFGGYVQPTVSVNANLPGNVTVAPPSGGSLLNLQATTGRFMYHFGVPRIEEGKWYNYSCYTYQPTTNPANMEVGMTLLGDSVNSGWRTEKGVWIRHDKAFMMDDAGVWACIETGGSGFTWDSNCQLYVAGVQLTEGRMPRPWIDGNKTLAGATYGWAGVTGTNGFVRAEPPTVSLPAQPDRARRKYYGVNWSYSQINGQAQDSAMIKVRKVR